MMLLATYGLAPLSDKVPHPSATRWPHGLPIGDLLMASRLSLGFTSNILYVDADNVSIRQ